MVLGESEVTTETFCGLLKLNHYRLEELEHPLSGSWLLVGTWYMEHVYCYGYVSFKVGNKKQDRPEITQIETCIITTQDAKHDLCAASKTPTKKRLPPSAPSQCCRLKSLVPVPNFSTKNTLTCGLDKFGNICYC